MAAKWGVAQLVKVRTDQQRADIFTKALPAPMFRSACRLINVHRVGGATGADEDGATGEDK